MATLKLQLPYATSGNPGGAYYAPMDGITGFTTNVTSPGPLIVWGQGIGTALSAFGWTKSATPTGTVNWGTVTLNHTTRTDAQNFPSTATLNHRGAWAQGVAYNTSDTVTDGGQTWVCSAGYTSTSTTGTTTSSSPYNEWKSVQVQGGTYHWFVFPFEVWQSATAPTIYIRFEYLGWTQANQNYLPMLRITVGTNVDSNGNLNTGAGNQQMGPFNCGSGTQAISAQNNFNSGYPCYFSGDNTNRFAMLMWYPLDFTEPPAFFCVERSINNAGSYYTTPSGSVTPYWTAIWCGFNSQNNTTGQTIMQSLVNTTGSTWIKTGQETTVTTCSYAGDHAVNPSGPSFITTGQGYGNQSTPAYPIWPLVGWVGNPMTAAMSFRWAGVGPEFADLPTMGGLFTQTMYGVSHTYLGARNQYTFGQFGPPNNNTSTNNQNYQNALAMRYD